MNGEIHQEGKRISVKGNIGVSDLQVLCAALYQAIDQRGYADVTLDFSICDGITEAVMLPLMPIVTKYRERNDIDFRLIEPQEDILRRLFVNANWAHYIAPDGYHPNPHEGGHVPALRFGDDGDEGQGEILDRVMGLILSRLQTDRDTLKAVEWSLGEIMDNVSSHAESPVGGFVQATAYLNQNSVEFVVADAGIGIPASMSMNDHAAALLDVINEGVTRDKTRNAGNGLFGSYQVATLSHGSFEIRSGFGLLYRTGTENLMNRRLTAPYQGTSVRCRIGLEERGLLDKALRFRGEPHDPPYDYIERKFESDEGDLAVEMKDEARHDFGSRQGGRRIRGMLENLLRERRIIVLDFSGVGVISSSFADEVFGRLFVDMGPRAFMTRIEMRHVDPTVGGLIDRAIVQRTRLGNGATDTG